MTAPDISDPEPARPPVPPIFLNPKSRQAFPRRRQIPFLRQGRPGYRIGLSELPAPVTSSYRALRVSSSQLYWRFASRGFRRSSAFRALWFVGAANKGTNRNPDGSETNSGASQCPMQPKSSSTP
ncbi:hypothetical protein LB565_09880 [Mesorhizobium sp. CA14]|uniref:hypothetical protein n=1 Tax=Mesorhizobium sp. CA14 TaxID=2876642 RepID=UPI001CCA7F2B|nr:hypothetical protein [Mesorhizobium sp. CA14]MBZ9848290.1 hypothetical protein [Mesorhizobium sp. CA14]